MSGLLSSAGGSGVALESSIQPSWFLQVPQTYEVCYLPSVLLQVVSWYVEYTIARLHVCGMWAPPSSIHVKTCYHTPGTAAKVFFDLTHWHKSVTFLAHLFRNLICNLGK